MRHQKKGFKLGRTHAHRKATLAALSTALIKHKRITTTLTKAKALRQYVEPVINRTKDASTHSRRQAFRYLRDKEAVKELFDEVAGQVADREGGYTRIVKLGQRAGDAAEMAIIELVDYNDVQPDGAGGSRRTRRTRRSSGRRRSKGGTQTTTTTSEQTPGKEKGVETTTVDEPVADAQAVPVPERTEPDAEAKAVAAEQADTAEAEAPEAEAPEAEAPEANTDTAEQTEEVPTEDAPAAETAEAPDAPAEPAVPAEEEEDAREDSDEEKKAE